MEEKRYGCKGTKRKANSCYVQSLCQNFLNMYLLDRKRIASYSQTLRHRLESQSHSQPVCWPTKSQNPSRSHQGPSSQSLRTDGDVMKGSIHRGRHGDSKTGTDSPRSHTTKAGGTWVPPLHQDPRHTPLCPGMKSGTGNLWKVSHCHIQKHRVSESHRRCGHDIYKTLATHDYLLTRGPSRKGQSSLVFYKNSTMYQIARAILNGGKNCILCKDAYHAWLSSHQHCVRHHCSLLSSPSCVITWDLLNTFSRWARGIVLPRG